MQHSTNEIILWYENKTDSIVQKYGSGPKVHFHTGYFESNNGPSGKESESSLKQELIKAQERLLIEAFEKWSTESGLGSRILDVGCGLGGTAIFLVEKFGVDVIALTNVPMHVKVVENYVKLAGVSHKVKIVLGDAHSFVTDGLVDSAVSIDSSCYFNRDAWFSRLSKIIRGGGHVFIADCFAFSEEAIDPFNEYWLTHLGYLQEYLQAAEKSGFILKSYDMINLNTENFWSFSIAYSKKQLAKSKSTSEKERLSRSIGWQSKLFDLWRDRKIQYGLISFELPK